jgi:mannose-6-phosphate isomerase-like protein (cupin superfamily)
MIKRKSSFPIQHNEKMRGGEGVAVVESLLTPDELYKKGRLFAKITLQPGSSIGYHVHEGEMEAFYIISGEAEFLDEGKTVIISPGDATLTRSGEGHSIKSIGDKALELIALILYK